MTRDRSLRPASCVVRSVLLCAALFSATGCVHQQLVIKSTPPGADVLYNGQLIGQTPLVQEFLWYEPYRIRVEKEGLSPLQENGSLKAPFWMWFPIDGVMAVLPLPLKDRHYITFDFEHPKTEHVAAAAEPQEPVTTHAGLFDDLRRIHQQPQ